MMWRPKTEKETAEYVLNNLNISLRDLQTDYVDLFFLHHKDEPGWIPDEVVEAVRIAKKQGKVRHAGITTHTLPKMADYLVKSDLFEAVIPMYNFTMDAEMHAAAKKVHDAGIGVIAMKVMAGGLRTEKPLPQLKRPGALDGGAEVGDQQPERGCGGHQRDGHGPTGGERPRHDRVLYRRRTPIAGGGA